MPNINQIQSSCNDLTTQVFNKITARQGNYYLNKLRYWGGIWTHSSLPAHTTSKWDNLIPDQLISQVTEQYESWIASIPDMVSVATPCAFRVVAYDGPTGKGYELQAAFKFNGNTWERHLNIGPETTREMAWTEYLPS